MDIITPDSVNKLLLSCAELTGEQDFGLNMNENIDITMYGLFGYLLLNSSTVEDLFNNIDRYFSLLYVGGGFFEVTKKKGYVNIGYNTDQAPLVSPRHFTEWSLGFIPYYLNTPLGDIAKPLSAQFTYDPPDNIDKLESVFGKDLKFNQPKNLLVYRNTILKKRINDVDPGLLKILREEADKYLKDYLIDETLLGNIKMLLIEHLSNGKSNASDIASELNLTLSTFKRRLADNNIDFKKTKELIKNDLAKKMLCKTKVKLTDIARKTGFSDQSSFTRFFIRCNTITPQEFRKKHLK